MLIEQPKFEIGIEKPESKKEKIGISDIVEDFQKEKQVELDNKREKIKELEDKGEKSKKIEEMKLKFEGRQIYFDEFVDKLGDILEHKFSDKEGKEFVLSETINEHLEKFTSPDFSKLSIEKQAESQKEFVKDLINQINKIPSDTWSFYFDRSLRTKKLNCSGCATLTGLILQSSKKITRLKNIEYGSPPGHAMNIITFTDNKIFRVDSRNNIFENLTDNIEIQKADGLKIYKIKKLEKETRHKIIPITSVKNGTISAYLDNLYSAYKCTRDEPPKGLEDLSSSELEEAKEVFQEKQIPLEKIRKIGEIFYKGLHKYRESEDFIKEEKRWLKAKKLVEERMSSKEKS